MLVRDETEETESINRDEFMFRKIAEIQQRSEIQQQHQHPVKNQGNHIPFIFN